MPLTLCLPFNFPFRYTNMILCVLAGDATPAVWKGVVSQEKVALIQSSYAKIDEKIGALGFGKEFYTVLFEMAPAAQALFKST